LAPAALALGAAGFLIALRDLANDGPHCCVIAGLTQLFGCRPALRSKTVTMPSHKFQIGEIVYVRPAISRNVPGGAYAVTKQLPHNGQEFEYRIKSASEEHERVVRESELTKA